MVKNICFRAFIDSHLNRAVTLYFSTIVVRKTYYFIDDDTTDKRSTNERHVIHALQFTIFTIFTINILYFKSNIFIIKTSSTMDKIQCQSCTVCTVEIKCLDCVAKHAETGHF